MLLFEGPQGCCCSKALRGVAVRRPSGVLLFEGPQGCCCSKALRGVVVRRPSGVLLFEGPQGCCCSKALKGVAVRRLRGVVNNIEGPQLKIMLIQPSGEKLKALRGVAVRRPSQRGVATQETYKDTIEDFTNWNNIFKASPIMRGRSSQQEKPTIQRRKKEKPYKIKNVKA